MVSSTYDNAQGAQGALGIDVQVMNVFADVTNKYGKEGSPAEAYLKECKEMCEKFLQTMREDGCHDEKDCALWRQERDTWVLIDSLSHVRASDNKKVKKSAPRVNPDNPTTRAKFNRACFRNKTIEELHTIATWLERQYATDHLEQLHAMIKETDNYYKLTRRSSRNSLDPDSHNRGDVEFEKLDLDMERELMKTIFSFLRAGNLEKAQEFADKQGHAWLAAALEGMVYYHDPMTEDQTLHPEQRRNDPVVGNCNRKEWQLCCKELAANNGENYERAIFSILGGVSDEALRVCDTFEDALWVLVKVTLESLLDEEIEHEGSTLNKDQGFGEIWPIISEYNVTLQRESDQPFHFIQSRIIDDELQDCIKSLWKWVSDEFERVAAPPNDYRHAAPSVDYGRSINATNMSKHMMIYDIEGDYGYQISQSEQTVLDWNVLRFIVQFVIFLRMVQELPEEKGPPPSVYNDDVTFGDAANALITKYILYMIETGEPKFEKNVAIYCKHIPTKKQVELYALYLEKVQDAYEIFDVKNAVTESQTLKLSTAKIVIQFVENNLIKFQDNIGFPYNSRSPEMLKDLKKMIDSLILLCGCDEVSKFWAFRKVNRFLRLFLLRCVYDKEFHGFVEGLIDFVCEEFRDDIDADNKMDLEARAVENSSEEDKYFRRELAEFKEYPLFHSTYSCYFDWKYEPSNDKKAQEVMAHIVEVFKNAWLTDPKLYQYCSAAQEMALKQEHAELRLKYLPLLACIYSEVLEKSSNEVEQFKQVRTLTELLTNQRNIDLFLQDPQPAREVLASMSGSYMKLLNIE